MKVRGKKVIEMLRGLAEGDSVLVGSDEWTALGDMEFERIANFGDGEAEIVGAGQLHAILDTAAEHDVRR